MKRASINTHDSSKKPKVQQSFREAYSKEWPCFVESRVSPHYVFCKVCSTNFSIAHGGRDDCRRHSNSKKHLELSKVLPKKPLESFFGNNVHDPMKAELLFTAFLIEHNLPLSVADHAKPLFQAMFPDSEIAKKYSCARSKTSALVQFYGKNAKDCILNVIRNEYFSLSTDGSNDFNDKKLYPLVITFFDQLKGLINTIMLSMLECSDNTGKGIFSLINDEFQKNDVTWKNCISFSSDNAHTMTGIHKGVISFIKDVKPSIINMKCSCHLINLASKKACLKLNFDVENFVIRIFYYLEKSSKRKTALRISQALCNSKPHKILKHISTRWLSLEESINRVLEQWDALEHFFDQENEKGDCNYLKDCMKNPISKLYCLFLSSTLPIFNSTNKELQQEKPMIHLLRQMMMNLLTNLVVRFVKPSAVKTSDLSMIDFEITKNHKENSDIVIGSKTRVFLKDNASFISNCDLTEFYHSVKHFYISACQYIVKKCHLNDEFLKHAEVANIELRKSASYSSILYLNSIFDCIPVEKFDNLETEFALFQIENFNFENSCRIDEAWHEISLMKDGAGKLKYEYLSKLMKCLLIIPHSNASSERIFSLVRKNMTAFRPNLGLETLNALLTEKVMSNSNSEYCYNKKFTAAQLTQAKSQYKNILSDH